MSRGRGKAQKNIDLIAASIRILAEIQPATVRAVCYRLFTEGLIPSMDKKHTARVGVQLTDAREAGDLPWDWIVDETRRPETVSMWNNPEALFEDDVAVYRKNYWKEQPNWIEVWSEKGTVRGTLASVLEKYAVTFRVFHGFNSSTVMHDVAEMTTFSNKTLTVLYVGDFDPSGMCMSEIDIPKRLERYGGEANMHRIAITATDTECLDLPSFPASDKKGDSRYEWFKNNFGHTCWELDALSPVMLRERVELEIFNRLDLDAWNHAMKIEAAERESMRKFVRSYRTISGLEQKYPPEAP